MNHRAHQMLKAFVVNHPPDAEHDLGTKRFSNPVYFARIKLIKKICRDPEGNDATAGTEFRKHIRAIDIVWAAHDNCGGLLQDSAQYRCEGSGQDPLPHDVAMVSENQSPALPAGQVSKHGAGIGPVDMNDVCLRLAYLSDQCGTNRRRL